MADSKEKRDDGLGFRSGQIPLLRGLQALQTNTKYADFTIKRGIRSWKVHKAVICPQSEFFSKACDGNFEVTKEAEKNAVTLEDDEDAISAMIHYFYHFDYVNEGNSEEGLVPVILDIRVFAIADKYFVHPLREIALENIRTRLSSEWDREAFPTAIKEIYALDPVHRDVLKPEAMSTIAKHRELLTRSQEYKTFHDLIRELNDFGADAAIAVAASVSAGIGKVYKCPNCKGDFSVAQRYANMRCPNDRCYGSYNADSWSRWEVKG